MKPKDLPTTIKSFCTRKPSFDDGVLTIPSFYDKHNIEELEDFSKKLYSKKKLHIEFCSGNGEWIIERAMNNPDTMYVAVEKKFMRVRKIWAKMKNHSVDNILVCAGMGEDLLNHYIQKSSVDHFFINFPDPWPKKRHAKHRIVKKPFIDAMKAHLKHGGEITITTDSDEYSSEIIELFSQEKDFTNAYGTQGYTKLDETYGGSYFKRLWKDLGRINKLMNFKKTISDDNN